MFEELFLLGTFLIIITAVFLSYRRMKRIKEEYEKAKEVVGDIVISFNRQVQRQENKLEILDSKTEVMFSKIRETEKKIMKSDRQFPDLLTKVQALLGAKEKVYEQIRGMEQRFEDVYSMREKMMRKIEEMKKVEYQVPSIPETKIETVIPIKREKALAPLNETELGVLHILATKGAKTAPEIRERIKLTREHTARLMKKLYEAGYLERDTRKIPYAYRIKKEMLSILKKIDAKS